LTTDSDGTRDLVMRSSSNPCAGYRYPPEIIAHTVWLYHRFCLSLRDFEDLLAERGVIVSHETIRQWCLKFGQSFAKRLRSWQGRPGNTWILDEVFITIGGERRYLWRRVRAIRTETRRLVERRRLSAINLTTLVRRAEPRLPDVYLAADYVVLLWGRQPERHRVLA